MGLNSEILIQTRYSGGSRLAFEPRLILKCRVPLIVRPVVLGPLGPLALPRCMSFRYEKVAYEVGEVKIVLIFAQIFSKHQYLSKYLNHFPEIIVEIKIFSRLLYISYTITVHLIRIMMLYRRFHVLLDGNVYLHSYDVLDV